MAMTCGQCGAYHDSQRQLASAARELLSGRVGEGDAALYALEGEANESAAPFVPRVHASQAGHWKHEPDVNLEIYPACVARKVPKGEWARPRCRTALDAEWERLRTMPWPDGKGSGTWDESRVEEAAVARKRARDKGKDAHFSRICELLYDKHSEFGLSLIHI